MIRSAVVFRLLVIAGAIFGAPPARSISVSLDPIGLVKSSQTVSDSLNRTMIQLQALEGTANYHLEARLEQVRSIVHDLNTGAQDTVARAELAMLTLEKQVNKDAVEFLYRTQCAAAGVTDQLQRAFAGSIQNLIKADPSINILGLKVVEGTANPITIDNPDDAYNSTKLAVMSRLEKDVKDSSRAYMILSAYQNLERGAKLARCSYIDQAGEDLWLTEVNNLERLSRPWVSVVQPSM
jgi:hypothetical protein